MISSNEIQDIQSVYETYAEEKDTCMKESIFQQMISRYNLVGQQYGAWSDCMDVEAGLTLSLPNTLFPKGPEGIQYRKIRTIDNLFIVGIAVSDIGQAILGVPLVVLSSFNEHWIFGHTSCQYYAFITTFLGISQIALLTLLAIERYFIIVRCHRKLSRSFYGCISTIATSFLFGLAWALGPLVGWSSYEGEIKGIACSVSWEIKDFNHLSYTISLFTFGWFIPLLLIAFGYASIAWTISRNRTFHQQSRHMSVKRCNRDRKVSTTVFFMIGAFVISWLPYSIVSLWAAVGNYNSIPAWAQVAPAVIAKCSIIWNPIIYVARHSSFRNAIRESIICFKVIRFLTNRRNENMNRTVYIDVCITDVNEEKQNCDAKFDTTLLDNNDPCDNLDNTEDDCSS